MRFRTHLFIVFLFLLTVCSYAGTLPTYDVIQIGDEYFIGTFGVINNLQQAVGVHWPYRDGVYEKRCIYIWENGIITDLNENIELGEFFNPMDVNDHCQIIGWCNSVKGFIWDKGEFKILESLGGDMCSPASINNNNQVVGTSTTADRKTHAFLWENGVTKDLGVLGGESSNAFSINNKGQIVGNYTINTEGKVISKAFLYENGEMHDLGINGTAFNINDSGQIIGLYNTGGRQKLFFLENGKMTDIDIDRNYDIAWMSLNNKSQVLVLASNVSENICYLWTKETGCVNIQDLLTNESTDIYMAFDINDNGVIVGSTESGAAAVFKPSAQQAVIPPILSFKSGLYNKPIQVKITCATENAVIRYTTNGDNPTEADPTIESGGIVLIDKDTVLKAKAWRSDCKPSGVRESKYTIRQKTWKGLAMVSIPTTPSNADPKLAVGFSNNYWYAYNATAKVYAGYPDQYTWFDISADNTTRAFWAKFNTETPVPEGDYLNLDSKRESLFYLKPGWNMIGQPFISAYKWDTSQINVSGYKFTGYLKDSGQYVQPFIWGWKQSVVNPNTGAYYRVGDPSVYPDAVGTMEPFEGYWIKAKKECTLFLPIPAEN